MNKKFWLIFLVVFIDLLGFGIVLPTLPYIAEKYGATALQIGMLASSYSLFQLIASPILGRLSDKYGRKPILTLSVTGTAIGFFIIAFANNLWLLFLSRIIDGFTGGNISVAQAYIADNTEGKERTKAMGLIGASFGLGFILGPLVGGLLSTISFSTPFLFAGVLALTNGLLIMIYLPRSNKRSASIKTPILFSLNVIKEVFRPKIILYLAILYGMITFSFSLMQGIMPLFTQKQFHWDQIHNGYYFAFIGIIAVISQGIILRKLVDRYNEKTIINYALILIAFGFFVTTFSKSVISFYFGGLFIAGSFGMLNSSLQAEISKYSLPEEQGIVMGTVQSFSALARTIGPTVGGLVFGFSIKSPFALSTILLFICWLGSFVIFKKKHL